MTRAAAAVATTGTPESRECVISFCCCCWRRMIPLIGLVLLFLLQGCNIGACYKEEDGLIIEYDSFDEFKNLVDKTYAHPHDEYRSRLAFEENQEAVREHNKLHEIGKTAFRMRANVLADMNSESYLKKFLRLMRSKRNETIDLTSEYVGDSPLITEIPEIPESLDWRKKGFVTKADSQGTRCGSCYAFSIAGTLEGQVFKRTGTVLRLSPQQIIDCSTRAGNFGCVGGSLRNTLKYLQSTGGIMRFKDYQYTAKKGKCRFVPELSVVNVTSWAILPAKDEKALEAAVAHIGPVAVSINATPKSFQLYSDGIYDDPACSASFVNHAMLIVGYSKDHWILKNWWSKGWGEDGYMRIRKGKNMCGIANYAAYSVV